MKTDIKAPLTIIIAFTIAFTFSQPKYAFALVGVSETALQAINTAMKNELIKQGLVIKEQLDTAKKTYDSLYGTYSRGKKMFSTLTGWKDRIDGGTDTFISYGQSLLKDVLRNSDSPVKKYDTSDIKEISKGLDTIYLPDATLLEKEKTKETRKTYEQLAIKSALESSEFIIKNQEVEVEQILELARAIDKIKTMKEAIDHNTRAVLENTKQTNELKVLIAKQIRFQTALVYEGVNADTKSDGKPKRHKENFNARDFFGMK